MFVRTEYAVIVRPAHGQLKMSPGIAVSQDAGRDTMGPGGEGT